MPSNQRPKSYKKTTSLIDQHKKKKRNGSAVAHTLDDGRKAIS
jgi:hypothetical protein